MQRGFTTGASVTLTAAASAGSTFAGWSGACSGTGACTVAMTQARSVAASFNASGGGCTVTATPLILQNQPWYTEEAVRLDSTGTITALSVSVVIQRTTGVSFAGQYNTANVQQSNSSTSSVINYSFGLGTGQTLGPGTDRRFVGQASGTGTPHPTSGDRYSVAGVCGGVSFSSNGTF